MFDLALYRSCQPPGWAWWVLTPQPKQNPAVRLCTPISDNLPRLVVTNPQESKYISHMVVGMVVVVGGSSLCFFEMPAGVAASCLSQCHAPLPFHGQWWQLGALLMMFLVGSLTVA
jgi:hypothetical protein